MTEIFISDSKHPNNVSRNSIDSWNFVCDLLLWCWGWVITSLRCWRLFIIDLFETCYRNGALVLPWARIIHMFVSFGMLQQSVFSLIFTWNVLVWITVIASKTEYISLPHTHHFSIFWLLMSRVWSQSTLNFVLPWGGMIRLLNYCCITSWKDKHMCNSAMEIEVHVRITTKGQVIIYDRGGDWVFFAWSWKFFPAYSSISYKVLWLTHTSCEKVWGTLTILSYFYA